MPLVKQKEQNQPSQTKLPARKAGWLLRDYNDHVWLIADSHGGPDVVEVDFRYRMPDGRCLTEWTDFYKTLKEHAFLVRDKRYSRIRDAKQHRAHIQGLQTICHALALDGFSSFRHVNRDVVDCLLPRLRLGSDALLRASARVRLWLRSRETHSSTSSTEGLPLYQRPDGSHINALDHHGLMQLVGLPGHACQLPRVAHLCNKAAAEAGLTRAIAPAGPLPRLQRLSAVALNRYVSTLSQIHLMRGEMRADSLQESPFAAPPGAVCRAHGRSAKSTPIPPAVPALHLLSQALLWVTDYSRPLLDLVDQALKLPKENRRSEKSFKKALHELISTACPSVGPEGSPWPLSGKAVRYAAAEELSPQGAIRMLVTACFIVIAAFSARRLEEIQSLKADAIRGNDQDGYYMRAFIQKTLRDDDWIPVPPVVARAFDALSRLSAPARRKQEEPNSEHLFQWLSPFYRTEKVITRVFCGGNYIDAFARWVKTPLWSPDGMSGVEWHFAPHQFRKLFAVLYFYRYRGATIEVLARYLRHFNLEMTRKYLTMDLEMKRLFDEVEWGYTKQIVRTVRVHGEATLGGGSKRIARMLIEEFQRNVTLAASPHDESTEEVEERVARRIRTQRLVVTPKAWVDCSCPETTEAAKSANCRANQTAHTHAAGPDFTRAGPSICCDCPFAIDNGRMSDALDAEKANAVVSTHLGLTSGTMLEHLHAERVIRISRFEHRETAHA